MVSIHPGASVMELRRALPDLLLELEVIGINRVVDIEMLRYRNPELHGRLAPLGIDHLDRYTDDGPGRYTSR